MKKILIIRFSSIGDVVLTTPELRTLKTNSSDFEVHYITKKAFFPAIELNPNIDKIYTIEKEIDEVISELKKEKYDFIIDLHNNLRSRRLSMQLGVNTFRFRKLNFKKWLLVNFKINKLPNYHIVDRYIETLNPLKLNYQNQGLDFPLLLEDEMEAEKIKKIIGEKYHAFVVGGAHFTKQIPVEIFIKIAQKSTLPIVLLGGKADFKKAEEIISNVSEIIFFNACGTLSLRESAAVIKYSQKVISSDTGMMHIAAALHKPIISLWGSTVPEFGMYPYFQDSEKHLSQIFEVSDLNCRPCSKIGFSECPKKHFNCMMKQDVDGIVESLK
jgi:ADP-heptose:LPS heptosyltransferase